MGKNPKKTSSKKLLEIESQYISLLKAKLKSLQNWEFEKKIYKNKLKNLKYQNKKLKKKLKKKIDESRRCSIFSIFSFASKILPGEDELESSNEDDNLLSSTLTSNTSTDSLFSSLGSVTNYDSEDKPKNQNNDNESNNKYLKTAIKVGAVTAAGLII